MLEITQSVPAELVAMIERTVHAAEDPFGLRAVEVRAGQDHDGDPAIFVEAIYDLSATPIDPGVNAKLSLDLWLLLLDAGESRFPYVRHKYHERQTVKDSARQTVNTHPKGKRRRRSKT